MSGSPSRSSDLAPMAFAKELREEEVRSGQAHLITHLGLRHNGHKRDQHLALLQTAQHSALSRRKWSSGPETGARSTVGIAQSVLGQALCCALCTRCQSDLAGQLPELLLKLLSVVAAASLGTVPGLAAQGPAARHKLPQIMLTPGERTSQTFYESPRSAFHCGVAGNFCCLPQSSVPQLCASRFFRNIQATASNSATFDAGLCSA